MKVWQFMNISGMYFSGVFSSERAALLWKEKLLAKFPEMSKFYKHVFLQSCYVVDVLGVESFFE